MQAIIGNIPAGQASQGAGTPVPAWVWAILVLAAGVACATDLRSMRIPNWLTLPLLAAGLLHAAVTGGGGALLHSVAASLIAGSVFIIGYVAFRGGGGDAKLMLALGSWVSIDVAMLLLMSVTIVGFVQALIVVSVRGSVADIPLVVFDGWWKVLVMARQAVRGRFPNRAEPDGERKDGDEGQPQRRYAGWFPYAPAILLGTVGAWWYSVKFGGAH